MLESRKEQIKLRANYYNGMAVASVAAGGFGAVLGIVRENPNWWSIGTGLGAFSALLVLSICMREIGANALKDLDKAG